MPFYAVARGRKVGIYNTWDECKKQVLGYKFPSFRKFDTQQEAQSFIEVRVLPKKITNKERKPKNVKSFKNIYDSESEFNPTYFVYTDGSCHHNGRKNAVAGIGIYFGQDDPRNVSKRVVGKQTNNVAELTAILDTYSIIEDDLKRGEKVVIASDSEYAIRCATSYGEKCSKKNWSEPIPNRELVKQLYKTYKEVENVKFMYVKAHTNKSDIHSVGNYNADRLANMALE